VVLEQGQQRGGWTRRGGRGVMVVDLEGRAALPSNAVKAEEAEGRRDGSR
jgi:hypothetical protein